MESKPTIRGKTTYNIAFSCITWTTYTGDNNEYPKGLIVGGLYDGSAVFFDPEIIIQEYKAGNQEMGQGVVRVETGLYDVTHVLFTKKTKRFQLVPLITTLSNQIYWPLVETKSSLQTWKKA